MTQVRTAISYDDDVLPQVTIAAARSHRAISEVVVEAVRHQLADGTSVGRPPATLPRVGGGWVRAGVNREDREALADLLGDNEWPQRASS